MEKLNKIEKNNNFIVYIDEDLNRVAIYSKDYVLLKQNYLDEVVKISKYKTGLLVFTSRDKDYYNVEFVLNNGKINSTIVCKNDNVFYDVYDEGVALYNCTNKHHQDLVGNFIFMCKNGNAIVSSHLNQLPNFDKLTQSEIKNIKEAVIKTYGGVEKNPDIIVDKDSNPDEFD